MDYELKQFLEIISLKEEKWKLHPTFRKYFISNLGRCVNSKTYSLLKPSLQDGYYTYRLELSSGKRPYKKIHKLVIEAFVPNVNNLPCVNFKDKNKHNYHLDNLEWCSYSYNDIGYENEKWKKIPNFSSYLISDHGRCINTESGLLIQPGLSRHGYYHLRLVSDDGERPDKLVHRLVAEAFLSNPDNHSCINHKDENKANNKVENLEWCSHEYNNNYGMRKEKYCEKVALRHALNELENEKRKICIINKETNQIIAEFPSAEMAGKNLGYTSGNVIREYLNKTKKYCPQGKNEKKYPFEIDMVFSV